MNFDNLISECTAYDFKLTLEEKKPKSWLKSISAFANGIGGSLFFGVDNEGDIKGLADVQSVCETISHTSDNTIMEKIAEKEFTDAYQNKLWN